ncbi:copper amine oxidase N-terminal domain-containing protein [Alkalicoccus chagannorensis]|uniref:copper amine oxidase N-terminal domain-containing protein n=1 Tax=Alkalicoccus chagannorensis TaxID=427072 RepID=UPI0004099E0A|nr:copper amine oxidase N-terminal domain-containing protein [Alkalicoccus chagannorensis]
MKKTLGVTLAAVLGTVLFAQEPAAAEDRRHLDGAIHKNDRVLVPMRAVAEELGAQVTWIQEEQAIEITDDDNSLRFQIDNPTADINGEAETLEQAPILEDNTTMVPVRWLANTFGTSVYWSSSNQHVGLSGYFTPLRVHIGTYDPVPLTEEELNELLQVIYQMRDLSQFDQLQQTFRPYVTRSLMNEILYDRNPSQVRHDISEIFDRDDHVIRYLSSDRVYVRSQGGGNHSHTMELQREDGRWKMDELRAAYTPFRP